MTPRWQPSANFGERRDGAVPKLVVLHYTAMADADAALRVLCDPDSQVSAHYLIAPDGQILHLVEESKRAWHAGAGRWGGCEDVNSNSIGIELSNDGFSPFSAPQMDALEGLLSGILARWDISASGVIGHSDMAPGRKIDPGSRFDWRRLARQGLSIWPDSDPTRGLDALEFKRDLQQFGYTAEVADEVLLDAFRLRFDPVQTGPLTQKDCALAHALAVSTRHNPN
ncbi:MAG: N-acetylmuramoyl-L-alanine amidase [Pseudomonadota bacterium]